MPQGIRYKPAEDLMALKRDTPDRGIFGQIVDLLGLTDPETMLPTPAMVTGPAAKQGADFAARGLNQVEAWLTDQVRRGTMPVDEAKQILGFAKSEPGVLDTIMSVTEMPPWIMGSGGSRASLARRGASEMQMRSGPGAANTFAHEAKHGLDRAADPGGFESTYDDWLKKFGMYWDNPHEERAVKFAQERFPESLDREFERSLRTSVERARTNPVLPLAGFAAAGQPGDPPRPAPVPSAPNELLQRLMGLLK